MLKKPMFVATVFVVLLCATPLQADNASPLGKWTTFDDDTQQAKSIVEVYAEGDTLSAKIVKVLNPKEPNPKCDKCDGDLKDAPIEGLRFVWDMKQDGDSWSGGHILDPESGKVYKAKMSLDDNGSKLDVRGSLGPFGRTEVWKRD